MSTRLAVGVVLCVAIVVSGCPKHEPPAPRPAGSCELAKNGSSYAQSMSASHVKGKSTFTLDVSSTLGPPDPRGVGVFVSHVTLRRNRGLSLQADTQLSPGGLQIRVFTGDGFIGPRETVLTSADAKTFHGSIDGKVLAPFSVPVKPGEVRFADGAAIPSGTIEDDVKEAMVALASTLQARCEPLRKTARPAPPAPADAGGSDPPGHYSDPSQSAACDACITDAHVVEVACGVAGLVASLACGLFFPVCYAAAVAACIVTEKLVLATSCHAPGYSNSGGGPCCPTACNQTACCDNGETCVGPNGLCCSPTFRPCGTSNCCGPADTCMSDGTCCEGGHQVCNGVCCPDADQICNPNTQTCCKQGAVCGSACCDQPDQVCVSMDTSTCCARAHACGAVCCAFSETCSDPNQNTCTACSNCNGECCFGGVCCTGAQIFCDATTRSCQCRPDCAGKCGGAPDGCGGTCNASCFESVCFQGYCCQPDCTGRCGGASDGCGGVCNSCSGADVCREQTCCTPNCTNKRCGQPDGCGGSCSGTCPNGQFCTTTHVCKELPCGTREDCCGNGSCCVPYKVPSQCPSHCTCQ